MPIHPKILASPVKRQMFVLSPGGMAVLEGGSGGDGSEFSIEARVASYQRVEVYGEGVLPLRAVHGGVLPRDSFGVYRMVGEPVGVRGTICPGESVALRFAESHYMIQGASIGVAVPRSNRIYVTKHVDLPRPDLKRAARVTEMELGVDETFKIWGPADDLSIRVDVLSGQRAILRSNQTVAISRVGGFHYRARLAFVPRAAGSSVQLSGSLDDVKSIRLGIRRDRQVADGLVLIMGAPRTVDIGRNVGTPGELRI